MLPGSSSAGKPARVKKPKPPKTMNPFAPPTLTEQGQTAVVEQPKAAPQKNTKKSRVIPVLDNPYDIKWPAVHFDRMMPEVIDQAIQCLTECRLLNKDPQGRADQPIRQNLDPTPDHPVIIAFGLSRVTRLLTNWIRPPTLSPKDQVTTAAAPRGRSLPATREATAMPSDPNGPTTATATTTTPPTPTARRYFVFVFRNNDETDAMVDPLATLVPLCGPSFSLIPLDPASRDRFRKTIAGAGDGPSQLTCFLLGDGFAAFDQFWHSAREEFAFPSLPWLDSLYRARMNLPAREGEEEEGGDGEGGVLVSSQPLAVLPPTQVKVFQIPVPSPQSKKQKKGARAHREKLSPEERLANREMRKKRKLENIASQPSGSEPAPPPKKNNKKQKLNKVAQKTDEIPQVLPLNRVGSGEVGP
ncbi:hypothetical protein H4R33_000714 [Dimargaris cristalligena]|nr:hypothetical protein H4R33_000714 [Dimargaris cristalligena]